MRPDPNCLCGGYGVRQYQHLDDSEVTEEPCLCADPKVPVANVGGSNQDILEIAKQRWEAAGRGQWDTKDKESI